MGPTLSAVLDDARRRGFVGRAPELRSFTAALAGTGPVRVLFVHGPGGIGKSTLLDELRRRAVQARRPALLLHGRDLGGSIEDVATAVAALPDGPGPVLLVDGYELLTRLDRWFREHLLPSLPADSVVVLAGREPPDAGWSADPGWRQLLRRLDLGRAAAGGERRAARPARRTRGPARPARRARPRPPAHPHPARRGLCRRLGADPARPAAATGRRAVPGAGPRGSGRRPPHRAGHLRARVPDHRGPARRHGRPAGAGGVGLAGGAAVRRPLRRRAATRTTWSGTSSTPSSPSATRTRTWRCTARCASTR